MYLYSAFHNAYHFNAASQKINVSTYLKAFDETVKYDQIRTWIWFTEKPKKI